jgi:hypothetical protein
MLICDKGTQDSHLCLAALDTIMSIIIDPMFQLCIRRTIRVHRTNLVCILAVDTWKNVLKRLCNFIDSQLHRSPKDHTREMHSTCVAAYNTLITLIIEQPLLLNEYENLFKLCEIIELGISGEKAQVCHT